MRQVIRIGKKSEGPDADRRAYSAGMCLLATFFGDKKADRWCRQHGVYRQLAIGNGAGDDECEQH